MKNIIITIILFVGLHANAQYIIPIEQMANYTRSNTEYNHYFKDVNHQFDKFLGNWKYETTSELVEITIYKEEGIDLGSLYTVDALYVEFKFTQNGNFIFDTFSPDRSYLITGTMFRFPDNTNKYHFLYKEPFQEEYDSFQWLDVKYIPNSPGEPQLKWDVHINDTYTPQMPLNMIFTKQ
jgi:hypothetical protein